MWKCESLVRLRVAVRLANLQLTSHWAPSIWTHTEWTTCALHCIECEWWVSAHRLQPQQMWWWCSSSSQLCGSIRQFKPLMANASALPTRTNTRINACICVCLSLRYMSSTSRTAMQPASTIINRNGNDDDASRCVVRLRILYSGQKRCFTNDHNSFP